MTTCKGVISAGDIQTAQAGAEILNLGGNAIDAAVAAAFASFAAEMVLVNISGGGIATIHVAQDNQNLVYDFFSNMPSGAYNAPQTDFREVLIDFGATTQSFYIGRASVAVPGVVAGLCQMAQDYGRLPLALLLKPAIRLAKNGSVVSESQAYIAKLLHNIFIDTPASANLYTVQNRPVLAGEKLYNPALSKTLTHLGQQGASYFYEGHVAQALIADQETQGGLLTQFDLTNYQVQCQETLSVPYKGYKILLPSLSSIGGVLMAFTLKLLAPINFKSLSVFSPNRLQILAEAMRLTNVARRHLILTPAGVQSFLSYKNIKLYQTFLQNILAGATLPQDQKFAKGPNDTTHLSVLDAQGNMVSLTTSAGEGAGYVLADTGITLNNMLGEIDLHPQGFFQAKAGNRLQTMMSPTIVLKNEQPVLVLGSGGSTRIRSAIIQVLSNILDFDLPLAEAIALPRLHFEEDVLHLEGGVPKKIAQSLAHKGYALNLWPEKNMYFGGVHAVGVTPNGFEAVGDTRRGGVGLVIN